MGSDGSRIGDLCHELNPPNPNPLRHPRLPQRRSFFIAAFEFEHHPLDVSVILVPAQELQAFLRIAPLQNLDGFLRAPQEFISRDSACKDRSYCGRRAPSRNRRRDKFARLKAAERPFPPASATSQPRRCRSAAVWRLQRRASRCALFSSRVSLCASRFAFLPPRMVGAWRKQTRVVHRHGAWSTVNRIASRYFRPVDGGPAARNCPPRALRFPYSRWSDSVCVYTVVRTC